jgi:hypothetical protein
MEKIFSVKETTINATLQYLGKQPYADVSQLISTLVSECNQQLKSPEPTKPEVVVDNSSV